MQKNGQRLFTTLFAAVFLLLAASSTANATTDTSTTEVQSAYEAMNCNFGDERTITTSDGSTEVLGCYTLDEDPLERGYELRSTQTYICGSSIIINDHKGWFKYTGTAYASGQIGFGGNCGGAGIVTKASIKYVSNGKVLGQATAYAGQKKTVTVQDSLNPKAPKTQVYWNFTLK